MSRPIMFAILAGIIPLVGLLWAAAILLSAWKDDREDKRRMRKWREREAAEQSELLAASQTMSALEFARWYWRRGYHDSYAIALYMAKSSPDGSELRTVVVRLSDLSGDGHWYDGQWHWKYPYLEYGCDDRDDPCTGGTKLGRYRHHDIELGHQHWADMLAGRFDPPKGWGNVSELQLIVALHQHQGLTGLVEATVDASKT